MATQALTDLSIANAPKTPKIGDVRSKEADGTTTFYNKYNIGTPVKTTPSTTATPVITPATLTPSAAPVVSPAPTLTEVPKLQADIATQQEDALTAKVATDLKAAETGKSTALADYLKTLSESKGLSTLQAEAYATPGGVNDITPELNDINDQIRREQRSLDLAKRRIQEQGGGLAGGAIAEQQNLERVSLQKQADLSIIQMAVQGRYDSAKEIADRAVTAQFEEQTKKTDIAKFDYEENKDLFTTAEQRQYDLLFADRTAKLEKAKQDAADIKSFALSALQAGASVAEVQKAMGAKTLDEAISLVGGYLRPKPVATSTKRDTAFDKDGNLVDMQTGEIISKAGGGAVAEQQQQQLNETLAIARDLLGNESTGKGSAVGASLAKFVPFGMSVGLQGNRAAFENKVNTLKANLTLPSLTLLKGPMSDKDIMFLQAIGSTLTTNMSEKEFDNELQKVVNKLESKAATPTVTGTQVITAPDGLQVEIID